MGKLKHDGKLKQGGLAREAQLIWTFLVAVAVAAAAFYQIVSPPRKVAAFQDSWSQSQKSNIDAQLGTPASSAGSYPR